jgi:hypothetical protein
MMLPWGIKLVMGCEIVHTRRYIPLSIGELSMLLQEVKEQVFKLPVSDRLALVSAIIESLQDRSVSGVDRSGAIQRMRGLLKTDQPAPTDDEVAAMLEARRLEKYL